MYRSLVKVPTGPVQPGRETRLVSRAEVAADPPALQCIKPCVVWSQQGFATCGNRCVGVPRTSVP